MNTHKFVSLFKHSVLTLSIAVSLNVIAQEGPKDDTQDPVGDIKPIESEGDKNTDQGKELIEAGDKVLKPKLGVHGKYGKSGKKGVNN